MTTAGETPATDYFQVKLDAKAMKTSSVHGSLLFGSAQVFRFVLQLGSQVVLARLLFPADFGLVAMVYPVVNFAAIFSVGFGEAVIQRAELRQDQVSALFWVSTAASIVVALLVMAAAPLAALAYGEPRITLLMIVIASFMPLSALSGTHGSILARQMRFKTIVKIELAMMTVGTAVTVLLAWLGWSYWSLAGGTFALTVVGLVLNWCASDWRPSRPRYVPAIWDDLKFGSNVTGYNLATFLTTSADNLIIGMANGERALGLYDRSYRLVVQPVGQIISPIGRVAVPLLSRLLDSRDEYGRTYLTMVQAVIGLTVPGMLVCIVHGDAIVNVLLGPRWTEAGVVLSWISVSGLTSGVQATGIWLFISQARMRGLRRITIYTAIINVAAFAIGSMWGIEGVAIAMGLSYSLIATLLLMYAATRRGPLGPGALLRACAPFAGAGVAATALLVAVRAWMPLPALLGIILALAIAYAVFAVAAIAPPGERARLLGLWRMLKDARKGKAAE